MDYYGVNYNLPIGRDGFRGGQPGLEPSTIVSEKDLPNLFISVF